MPIREITVGWFEEFRDRRTIKAAVAEFFSTLIFVFAGQGSSMAMSNITGDGSTTPAGLVAVALAYAFGYSVAVAVGGNTSGGHVNPAVTMGAFVGGNITLIRGILYIIAQLLGSTVACLLLSFTTGGLPIEAFTLSGVSVWNAFVFEMVMTFGLVYTVNAVAPVDPTKGEFGVIAPIAIGFIVGANILAGK